MMRILFVLFILFILIGCDVEIDHCKYTTYDTTTDQVGATGILLRPGEEMYLQLPEMEAAYVEIEACIGMTAPGPDIWYTKFKDRGLGGGYAVIHYASQTVMLNTDDGLARNCISDRDGLKHEFVHHILYMNGEDKSHASPMFQKCAIGINTCNGVPC